MAKNPTNTPDNNQNGSKTTKAVVNLPSDIAITVSTTPLATRSSQSNPFVAAVRIANDNRTNTYDISGVSDQAVADKVVRLLQAASREIGCSVRASVDLAGKIVKFKAIDKVTRTAKPATV